MIVQASSMKAKTLCDLFSVLFYAMEGRYNGDSPRLFYIRYTTLCYAMLTMVTVHASSMEAKKDSTVLLSCSSDKSIFVT